jgi:NAD-dependent DNA ligase
MANFDVGGAALGRLHRKANDKKFFCYFTGFIQGIVASGGIEAEEVKPLLDQCIEFVRNVGDEDAFEIIEDFNAELLEADSLFDAAEYRMRDIDPDCERSALNRFLGFCAGIACDDRITLAEAEKAIAFVQEQPSVLEDVGARAVIYCCADAVEDGEISPEESAEICYSISRIVGDCYTDTGMSALGSVPVFEESKIDEILEGTSFVLTGAFTVSPRRILEDAILERGGLVAKSPSGKTDYVVVASEASRDWVQTHKGTKIIKAIQLREKSGQPNFLSEMRLLKILDL